MAGRQIPGPLFIEGRIHSKVGAAKASKIIEWFYLGRDAP
jgi:hypothetical protein